MSDKQFTKRKWLFWTRDMIEKFIVLLRENECMYNNKNKYYYNRHIKDEICEYILSEMQKYKPAIQIGDIRRKLKVLRTQFARENRLLALARLQGRVYEPKLWCYDKLSFLEKHTTCVTSLNKDLPSSHDDVTTFSDEETFIYDENEDSSMLMEIYKKEETITDNTDDPQNKENSGIKETNEEDTKTSATTENDQSNNEAVSGKYDWIGDLVVSQIEDIDITLRKDFVWDIQCLVRKYLLKSKITNEKNQPNKSTETETTTAKDVTFHKGSNISVNVNFL